jgi:hypothetical protein
MIPHLTRFESRHTVPLISWDTFGRVHPVCAECMLIAGQEGELVCPRSGRRQSPPPSRSRLDTGPRLAGIARPPWFHPSVGQRERERERDRHSVAELLWEIIKQCRSLGGLEVDPVRVLNVK